MDCSLHRDVGSQGFGPDRYGDEFGEDLETHVAPGKSRGVGREEPKEWHRRRAGGSCVWDVFP